MEGVRIERELKIFPGTLLGGAKRPQAQLFEPAGRVLRLQWRNA